MVSRRHLLRTAILLGLVCLFAFARVAQAVHDCHRVARGCCETAVQEAMHHGGGDHASVCESHDASADDHGSSASLLNALHAAAVPAVTTVLVIPDWSPPPAVHVAPLVPLPPPLLTFGRLRL